MNLIDKQFQSEFKDCMKTIEAYVKVAKETGKIFDRDIKDEAAVKKYKSYLSFFETHHLLTSIDSKVDQFNTALKNGAILIQEAK